MLILDCCINYSQSPVNPALTNVHKLNERVQKYKRQKQAYFTGGLGSPFRDRYRAQPSGSNLESKTTTPPRREEPVQVVWTSAENATPSEVLQAAGRKQIAGK